MYTYTYISEQNMDGTLILTYTCHFVIPERNVATYEAHWALDRSEEMLIILLFNRRIQL